MLALQRIGKRVKRQAYTGLMYVIKNLFPEHIKNFGNSMIQA
jgi:hypothetical protein